MTKSLEEINQEFINILATSFEETSFLDLVLAQIEQQLPGLIESFRKDTIVLLKEKISKEEDPEQLAELGNLLASLDGFLGNVGEEIKKALVLKLKKEIDEFLASQG